MAFGRRRQNFGLEKTVNPVILKDAHGTNPGGTRFVYDVAARKEVLLPGAEKPAAGYILTNTGYVALQGASAAPNLHPNEVDQHVAVTDSQFAADFVRI